jgi:hypothetical protein
MPGTGPFGFVVSGDAAFRALTSAKSLFCSIVAIFAKLQWTVDVDTIRAYYGLIDTLFAAV